MPQFEGLAAAAIGLCAGAAFAMQADTKVVPDLTLKQDIQLMMNIKGCDGDGNLCDPAEQRVLQAQPVALQKAIDDYAKTNHQGHTSSQEAFRHFGIDEASADALVMAQVAGEKLKSGNMDGACAAAKASVNLQLPDDRMNGIIGLSCRDVKTPKAEPVKEEKKNPDPPADGLAPGKFMTDTKVRMPEARAPGQGQASGAVKMSDRDQALRSLATMKEDGNYSGLLSKADEILAAEPGNKDALNAKALAQNHQKDYKGALKTAQDAIQKSTSNAAAYVNKAFAEGALGDHEKMIEDLRLAASIDPQFEALLEKALNSGAAGLFDLPGEVRESKFQGTKSKEAEGLDADMLKWIVGAALGLPLMGLILFFVLRNTVFKTPPPKAGTPWPMDASLPSSQPLGGKYALGPEIGEGGMGMVFSGKDISLDRPVAIKKMLPQLAADPRMRARFVTEAKTVAALHHPHIVDIHAIVEEGGDLYLIFEYIAGKGLDAVIAERGRLPPAEAVKIVKVIAEALDFAHEKKVIHRDLKPSNVMVDARGSVKVMDFGLARTVKDFLSQSALSNHVVGTPAFMAPEQHLGETSAASDLFSLGVCVYEMLTGQLPFKGPDFLVQKERMKFPSPLELVPALPKALEAFMARALAAEPAQRFPSARELAAALEAAVT